MSIVVDPESLPYRPCAGIALFNKAGLVWIGRRIDGPRAAEGKGNWWQMPQGGIDDGEDPIDAARRELWEETNVTSTSLLGEMDWMTYDLPPELVGRAWRGRYRGQKIKWVAFRFQGADSEINVDDPGPGEKPEFTAWRWERLDATPAVVVPFKRSIYQQLAVSFASFGVGGGE